MIQVTSTQTKRSTTSHKIFMVQAVKQAELGLGYTSPNLAVGAVIVRNGRISKAHTSVTVFKKLSAGKNKLF